MKGKIIDVSEFDLNFGKKARIIEVYAAFIYKTNGNKYIIYKHLEEEKNILYFGSVHFKQDVIVILDIKVKEIGFTKEFVTKFINQEETKNYEILDISHVNKAEIISENKEEVDGEKIAKLRDLTMPKPEVVEVSKRKSKKGIVFLIVLLILIISSGVIYYFFKDDFLKEQKRLVCFKEYTHESLNANVEEEYIIVFDGEDNVLSIDKNIAYVFIDEHEYNDFRDNNDYYEYIEEGSTYKLLDTDITLQQFIKEKNLDKYPDTYNDVLEYYNNINYSCSEDTYD